MHVGNISITNLKGLNFETELQPLTYIHGENRSCKTAILDAIRLALLGYHPDVSKRPAGIMEFASGDVMKITLSFADSEETGVLREWKRATRGVRSTVVPKDFEPDPRLCLALDSSLYFSKSVSDNDRVKLVFDLVSDEETTPESVIASIKSISIGEEHSEAAEKYLATLVSNLSIDSSQPVQIWLSALALDLKDRASGERASVRQLKESMKGLSDLASVDALLQAMAKPLSQSDIDAMTEKIEELVAKKTKLEEQQRASDRNLSLKMELEDWFDENPLVEIGQLDQIGSELAQQRKELEVLETDIEKSEEAEVECQNALARIGAQMSAADKSVTSLGTKLDEIAHLEACPFCKTKRKGWENTAKRELEKEKKNFDEELGSALKNEEREKERLASIRETLDELTGKRQSVKGSIETDDERLSTLRRYVELYDQKKDELDRLTASEIDEEELEQIETDLEALRESRDTANETRKKFDETTAMRAAIEKLSNQLDAAEMRFELLKLAEAAILDEKRDCTQRAFGPVLDVANRFCEGVLPGFLVQSDGELGVSTDESFFYGHRTFSGSEKSATVAGICLGLAASAPFRIALFDEFDNFSEKSKIAMLENIRKLISDKVLDQVVITSWNPFPLKLKKTEKRVKIIDTGSIPDFRRDRSDLSPKNRELATA